MAQTTPASLLQELCIQQDITADYRLTSVSGAVHEPTFVYSAKIDDIETTGSGTSKKKAKHAAAKIMLEILLAEDGNCSSGFMLEGTTVTRHNLSEVLGSFGVNDEPEETPAKELPQMNPMSELQEICVQNKWTPPNYDTLDECGPPHDKTFTMNCEVYVRDSDDLIIEVGIAKSKRNAKRVAAEKILEKLKKMGKRLKKTDEKKAAESNPEDASSQSEAEMEPCSEGGCISSENAESTDMTMESDLADESREQVVPESNSNDDCPPSEVAESIMQGSSLNDGCLLSEERLAAETKNSVTNESCTVNSVKDKGPPVNPLTELLNLCVKYRWTSPKYDFTDESGPAHDRTFTMNCKVLDNESQVSVLGTGTAKNKKCAKQLSAEAVLQKLEEMGKRFFKREIEEDTASSSEEENMPGVLGSNSEDALLQSTTTENTPSSDDVLLKSEKSELSTTVLESDSCDVSFPASPAVQDVDLDGLVSEIYETEMKELNHIGCLQSEQVEAPIQELNLPKMTLEGFSHSDTERPMSSH